jgi:serine protease Do
VTFNNGARVEDLRGKVLDIKTLDAGEFDAAMPPDGWVNLPLETGKTWRANYRPKGYTSKTFDLTATVVGEETILVPAGEFKTMRVNWKGYAGSRSMAMFNASVWYSTELNRVVKFTIDAMHFAKNEQSAPETLELASRPSKK